MINIGNRRSRKIQSVLNRLFEIGKRKTAPNVSE